MGIKGQRRCRLETSRICVLLAVRPSGRRRKGVQALPTRHSAWPFREDGIRSGHSPEPGEVNPEILKGARPADLPVQQPTRYQPGRESPVGPSPGPDDPSGPPPARRPRHRV